VRFANWKRFSLTLIALFFVCLFCFVFGSGVVYKGLYNGREVAVKNMLVTSGKAALEEFLAEAELMAQIPPHDNVLAFIGLLSHAGSPSIITEFCAGSSLLNAYESAPLPEDTLWFVVRGICAGMQHLAASHIVHREYGFLSPLTFFIYF
jgi:serine/threonine protein kinase